LSVLLLENASLQELASLEPEQPAASKGGARRDLGIALSLANLCYLRVWSELLTYRRADTYLMKSPPGPAALAAVMANVVLLAVLMWGMVSLARKRLSRPRFRWVQAGFLVFLAVPLNALREVAAHINPYMKSSLFELLGTRGVTALAALLALAGGTVVLFCHRKYASLAAKVLVLFLPFCVVTFAQGLWSIASYHPTGFAPRPLAPPLPHAKASPRVVWILFDEWDYRLTFIDPDPTLRLPELERLSRESLVAGEALPPGSETSVSIPAYFTGRPVQSVAYDGARELQITFQGAAGPAPWSQQPSVFSSARELGFTTALVDWFHPTCRILSDLSSCEWWEMPRQFNSMGHTFWQQVPGQARSLFETTLFSAFGQSLAVRQQAETYHQIVERGIAVAGDPAYGLSFIHLPIPHGPHAYDRRTGQFTLKNSPIRGYFDSLALLDRCLGEIRKSMEADGIWDKTTVLITSDHPYRSASAIDGKTDPRIPYFLKMASQKDGFAYNRPFQTVLTHDLVLAILRGELARPEEVAAWLDRQASDPLN
jgi:Sulfatase